MGRRKRRSWGSGWVMPTAQEVEEGIRKMWARRHPRELAIPCPTCRVGAGDPCEGFKGLGGIRLGQCQSPHLARIRLAGV